MTCYALALVLCNLLNPACRKQASPGATHQTSRTSVDNAVSTKRAKLRASSRIHQPPPKIHHNPHKVPVPASPPPCHPRASAHILATCSPPIHSKYAGHLHGKEGLPGPFRRIDGGGSVPLRPVRAPRRVISSAPSTPEPAPAPAAAHPPGIRPRHRQARLPVGQAADAAHLQDRADRAGLRHHRCVRSCFCFVVVDGMDVMACRIMPDTTTRTWSGMFQRPRAFGMRLPVWLTCILHLHSTHVVV